MYVIEDEEILRVSLADDLKDAGYETISFEHPQTALDMLNSSPPDVVITDLRLPQIDGLQLLRELKNYNEGLFVIMMTAFASVDSAVEAMRLGAYDFVTKPFKTDEIVLILERIAELMSIKEENVQLRSNIESRYRYAAFLGQSDTAQRIREMGNTVSNDKTTVLISGETGTGKELLANIIHYNSNRSHKSLVKVGCAILSRELFESELFGHEKGAFTGAMKERRGRFELADGGSIYLDDIDDMPIDLQVKLLRVLEEEEFERVGSSVTIQVDTRVIASTKKDLRALVAEGKFREDLFYRLNVFQIDLAPLRDRIQDLDQLIPHFVHYFTSERPVRIPENVLNCMRNYKWPGNVRELKNVIERLLLVSRGEEINYSHVPLEILCPDAMPADQIIGQKPLDEVLSDIEKNMIYQTLLKTHGNQSKAAQLLGLPTSTLRTKIQKYNLNVPQ